MQQNPKARYGLLDVIRGITILNMIAYHAMWDIVWLFGVKCSAYTGISGEIWQQMICCSFILLSGFCWNFSRSHWKRGMQVFLCGVLISAVTILVMYESRIVFGVLTLLGSSMMLMIPLDKALKHVNPVYGAPAFAVLFLLFRNVNRGYLLWGRCKVILPEQLYHGMAATYLGFMDSGFYSSDYFSLLPWLLLFITGYFLRGIFEKYGKLPLLQCRTVPVISAMGRHSLLIYMLHQPVVYGILLIVFYLKAL